MSGLTITKDEALLIVAALENLVRLLNQDGHLSKNQREETKRQAAAIIHKLTKVVMPRGEIILPS